MKPFIDHAFNLNSGHSEIDWRDPAEAAMEREEQDDTETFDAGQIKAIPNSALLTILTFIISPAVESRSRRKRWDTSLHRLVVLAHACGVDGVADKSLTALAEELGCSRALMSHYAIRLTDELNQSQVRGGKSRASRETFRQCATASHQARGHKMRVMPEPVADDDDV